MKKKNVKIKEKEVTPILKKLIELSATILKNVESDEKHEKKILKYATFIMVGLIILFF